MEKAAGMVWVAVLICLLAQIAAQWAMRTPYNPLVDAVSDLGQTTCTPRFCSPWFWMVDVSFVLLGLCLALGGWLSHVSAPRLCWVSWVATVALSVGGAGMVAVGVFPENLHLWAHVVGAAVGLVGGNVGAAFAGWALLRVRGHHPTGVSGIVVGVVGLVGSALSALVFAGVLRMLIGVGGGLERLGVEPLLLVMAFSGGALLLGEDVLAVALRGLRRSALARGGDQGDVAPGAGQGTQVDVEPLAAQLARDLGQQEGQVVHHERRA